MGGSTTSKEGPDVALGAYTLSRSNGPQGTTRTQTQPGESARTPEGSSINEAAAAVLATTPIADGGSNTADARAVLTRCNTVSQAGDIPTARIGHAAVVVDPAQPKIILFGGEACIRNDGGEYPKLCDVYEGTPTEPSGTLVWRALSEPPRENHTPEVPAVGESDVAPDAPVPMAFHAACAASVRGEEAVVVHGGMNQSSELLGDLWAFFPRSTLGDGDHGNGGESICWERLQPEGER